MRPGENVEILPDVEPSILYQRGVFDNLKLRILMRNFTKIVVLLLENVTKFVNFVVLSTGKNMSSLYTEKCPRQILSGTNKYF